MSAYNFDKVIERRGTGCVKWDESEEGVIPLWVADMDFPVAPAIQEAIRKRANHPVFGYTFVQEDYYEAIISWFQRRHQWTIAREHILYTIGYIIYYRRSTGHVGSHQGTHHAWRESSYPVTRLQLFLLQRKE